MAVVTKKQKKGQCPPIEKISLDFHWWQDPPCSSDEGRVVSPAHQKETIPAIPIKEIPVEDRYPYRYCSAGPSQYEHLSEQLKLRLCMNRIIHDKQIVKNFDLTNIRPHHQYETTTLMNSMQPYRYNRANLEVMKCHLNKAMLYPKFTRHEIQDEFDEYVAGQLYPYWKKDTKYKRRLVYKLQPLKKKTDVDP